MRRLIISRFVRSLTTLSIGMLCMAGCYTLGNRIPYVALTSKGGPGTSIGPVDGRDCAIRVLGYGKYDVSFDMALQRLSKEKKVKFLRNVTFDTDISNYFVWSKTCCIIKGEGFQ